MTPLDVLDERASDLLGDFLIEDEIAVLIHTKGDDVRVVAPDYDRPYMAKMLRIAASMLEDKADHSLN